MATDKDSYISDSELRVVYTIYTGPQPQYLHRFTPICTNDKKWRFPTIYTDLHQFKCLFTPIYTSLCAHLHCIYIDLHHIYTSVNTEVVVHLHRFTPFTAYPQDFVQKFKKFFALYGRKTSEKCC